MSLMQCMLSFLHVILQTHQEQIVTFSDAVVVSRFKVSYWCGDVVTSTLCGSRCCNKAIVHNYNRWLKIITLLKNHWGLGSTATRWHWESWHPTFSFHSNTHSYTLSLLHCLSSSEALFFFSFSMVSTFPLALSYARVCIFMSHIS